MTVDFVVQIGVPTSWTFWEIWLPHTDQEPIRAFSQGVLGFVFLISIADVILGGKKKKFFSESTFFLSQIICNKKEVRVFLN